MSKRIESTSTESTESGPTLDLLNVVIDVKDVSMLRIEYMGARRRATRRSVCGIIYRIEIMGEKNVVKWLTMTTDD